MESLVNWLGKLKGIDLRLKVAVAVGLKVDEEIVEVEVGEKTFDEFFLTVIELAFEVDWIYLMSFGE